MDIKDFYVGQKVIYLDFEGRSKYEKAVITEGYVKKVGRKIVTIGKSADGNLGTGFVVDKCGLCLRVNPGANYFSKYDLAFADEKQLEQYVEYQELKLWGARLDANRLSYETLKKIYDIVKKRELTFLLIL